jgi:hypothetical protein
MEEERIVRASGSSRPRRAREQHRPRSARDRAELATVDEREERAAAALAEVRAADAADRDRLGAPSARAAPRASGSRRGRAAPGRGSADLEARLGATRSASSSSSSSRASASSGGAARERGRGRPGRGRPGALDADATATSGLRAGTKQRSSDEADETVALEAALDAVTGRWSSEAPTVEVPGPGRLATLRRRYHELGAANPFAVEEYDELRQRLETLETQQVDLRSAIDKTRGLIAELNTMIAEQFRTTFAALETAFDARFQQLFGGGFARLSLTDPEDLSATGVEIVARPPGKKAQALAMLSGGERALTAVALLFAMLEVRPVPFCVLDEVDAAPRRGESRPVLGGPARPGRADPVRGDHPQPGHDRGRPTRSTA